MRGVMVSLPDSCPQILSFSLINTLSFRVSLFTLLDLALFVGPLLFAVMKQSYSTLAVTKSYDFDHVGVVPLPV
jgi:hypothetical protein